MQKASAAGEVRQNLGAAALGVACLAGVMGISGSSAVPSVAHPGIRSSALPKAPQRAIDSNSYEETGGAPKP